MSQIAKYTLEAKGVTGPGKLGDYEALRPRLEALLQAHDEDLRMAADLERRVALLMDHYATNVRGCPFRNQILLMCHPRPHYWFIRWIHSPNSSYLGTKQYATRKKRSTSWKKTAKSGASWVMSSGQLAYYP